MKLKLWISSQRSYQRILKVDGMIGVWVQIACASFVGFMALFSVLSAQSTKWAETINASDLENHLNGARE